VIERIARDTALACVAMAVMFAIWKHSIVSSLAVLGGGLLIGISFWAIGSTVDQAIGRVRGETGLKAARFPLVKFFTRYAIVALAAYGMIGRLRVDPLGLLIGVSSFGVAVAVEVLRDLRWRRFP
jgi:hypothetical protein